MTIKLHKENILVDIREKSRLEVSEIADSDARYRAEAGSEKMEEIERCINAANSMLVHRCLRFLKTSYTEKGEDEHYSPGYYVFEFDMGVGRRANGKTEMLTEQMHQFVVHYALSRFYSSVSHVDLSNKHSLVAIDLSNSIDNILYTKLPPRV